MLDARFVADHPDLVRDSLVRRHASAEVMAALDALVQANADRRKVQARADELRASRNALSKEIGTLMREQKKDEAEALKARVRDQADELARLEEEQKRLEAVEAEAVMGLPNLVSPAIPLGKGDEDNVEVRRWGTPRSFDFTPKPHDELGAALGLFDTERATKVAGARFSVLWGSLARLERALISFFLDRATGRGYEEVLVPYIVSRTTMTGTGQLPKFEQDLFRLSAQVNGEDSFLIPTAEVPVTNLHRGEILDEASLPLRYCSFTPCFRSEAGSYGKDTRGYIRQHQFHKVELVKIATPDQAEAEWKALTGDAEALLQALELPYRVVELCTGDTGFGSHRTHDLEVWLPGQQAYREISSCSHFTDFQARRLGLRWRSKETGKTSLCHTINGSGLAVGRTVVAILENHQQADGTVTVPSVLLPYMGGVDRLVSRI